MASNTKAARQIRLSEGSAAATQASVHEFATFFWLVLVSAVFSNGVFNPFGIIYAAEIITALATLDLALTVLLRRPLPPLARTVFAAPMVAVFYSAIMAYISYGQPPIYGIIEERRMFELWVYFPLARHISACSSIRVVLKQIILLGMFISLLGLSYRLGIVRGWKEIEIGAGALRQARANFSGGFVIVSATIGLAVGPKIRLRALSLINFLLAVVFMLFVSYTRQYFLSLLIAFAALPIFGKWRPGARLAGVATGIFVLALSAILVSGLDRSYDSRIIRLYLQLFDESYLTSNARALAMLDVFRELSVLGHGALSAQWNDGFARVFGSYFFLSDIGIFGTLHRFGIFTVFYALATIYLLRQSVRGAAGLSPGHSRLAAMLAVLLVLNWPLGGILEYRGMTVALIMALSLAWPRAAASRQSDADPGCARDVQHD
jgi:hypothetical protein